MFRSFAVVSILGLAVVYTFAGQQDLKSGPQPTQAVPGSFQPFNVNGPFAGRQHSLVTENIIVQADGVLNIEAGGSVTGHIYVYGGELNVSGGSLFHRSSSCSVDGCRSTTDSTGLLSHFGLA